MLALAARSGTSRSADGGPRGARVLVPYQTTFARFAKPHLQRRVRRTCTRCSARSDHRRDHPQDPHARLLRLARRRDPLPGRHGVNSSNTARRAFDIGVTPTTGGEVDSLLEPVEPWPERTTPAPAGAGASDVRRLPCPASTCARSSGALRPVRLRFVRSQGGFVSLRDADPRCLSQLSPVAPGR